MLTTEKIKEYFDKSQEFIENALEVNKDIRGFNIYSIERRYWFKRNELFTFMKTDFSVNPKTTIKIEYVYNKLFFNKN